MFATTKSIPGSRASVTPSETPDREALSRLNAVRFIVVLLIGIGYASTMAKGPQANEWLFFLGYNPSLYGLQVLFFISGWLALRSLSRGRTIRQFVASRARRILPLAALYTLAVVTILYPLVCDHDAPVVKSSADLVLYFIKTVTLIAPGQPMPGALDQALYACILQGAIWSLRWGAIAYIGLLTLWVVGLRGRYIFAALAIITAIFHVCLGWWIDQSGQELFPALAIGARFGFAFLMGVAAYSWRDRLPKTGRGWGLIAAVMLGAAMTHYYGFRWSYTIEIMAASSWCALALALMHSRLTALQNWPDLIVPLYLGVWPTAQVILWAVPDVSVPALVSASVGTALALALLVRGGITLISRPVHRRIQTA